HRTRRCCLAHVAYPRPGRPRPAPRGTAGLRRLPRERQSGNREHRHVQWDRLAHRLPSQVEVSELISVGVLGLIDAAGRFRPGLGVPFDAFARRRIHGAMLDMLRDMDWASRSVRKQRRDLDAAIERLRLELGREPESGEVAEAVGVSEGQYDRMLDQLRSAELAWIRQAGTTE
ncbi:MAG: hypothetical protein FGM36_16275, partial [Burkholderiaceae bacterium]|nr:hypothetical protein [Burkholderiaceae bacterium]